MQRCFDETACWIFKCSLKIVLRCSGYQSHATFSAKKSRPATQALVDVNHLRLLSDCLQNLPEKVKPYGGPLVKIIILLSACKASSLTY